MDDSRLHIWEVLLQRALELIDSVSHSTVALTDWSFGGGTVLMRRHKHRFSKDIDIFITDPQYLGYLTPRLNDAAESLTSHYIEQARFLKLYFPEGEIDFVASAPLTRYPTITETLLGREMQVETSTEIIAKKLWHRGDQFTARDIFDFAMIIEREPEALQEIMPVVKERRNVVLDIIATQDRLLREAFNELDVLEYTRSFDECIELLNKCFAECDSTFPARDR